MKRSTDPIAQLMQEHNDALLQLKLMTKAAQVLSQDGYSTKVFSQMKAALHFIEEEVIKRPAVGNSFRFRHAGLPSHEDVPALRSLST